MGIIGGAIGYKLLRYISPSGQSGNCDGRVYQGRSKMEVLFGDNIWGELTGKTVADFGCGNGTQAIEIAQHGAAKVYGIDIREKILEDARQAGGGQESQIVAFSQLK